MPAAAPRSNVLPWVAYAVCAVVWGSTYFAIAVALESFPPYGMVAVRFGFASVLTLAVGRLFREPWPSRRELPHLALVGVLLLGICNALIVWSETRVSSGVAAVLAALTPAWFGVLTARTEPLGVRGWIGTGLGLRGRRPSRRARGPRAESTSAASRRSSWRPRSGRSERSTTEST